MTGNPTAIGYTQISAGNSFSCVLNSNGGIECWGTNAYGQLGGSSSSASWPTGFEAVDIDAGENHACALSSAGEIMWVETTWDRLVQEQFHLQKALLSSHYLIITKLLT